MQHTKLFSESCKSVIHDSVRTEEVGNVVYSGLLEQGGERKSSGQSRQIKAGLAKWVANDDCKVVRRSFASFSDRFDGQNISRSWKMERGSDTVEDVMMRRRVKSAEPEYETLMSGRKFAYVVQPFCDQLE